MCIIYDGLKMLFTESGFVRIPLLWPKWLQIFLPLSLQLRFYITKKRCKNCNRSWLFSLENCIAFGKYLHWPIPENIICIWMKAHLQKKKWFLLWRSALHIQTTLLKHTLKIRPNCVKVPLKLDCLKVKDLSLESTSFISFKNIYYFSFPKYLNDESVHV